MRFHHIGVATNNINEAIDVYRKVGVCRILTDKVFDQQQDATVQIIALHGFYIELVSGNRVKDILLRNIPVYHICFTTDRSLEEEIKEHIESGYRQVTKIKPAKLFGGKRVVFMYHSTIGLIEIGERI